MQQAMLDQITTALGTEDTPDVSLAPTGLTAPRAAFDADGLAAASIAAALRELAAPLLRVGPAGPALPVLGIDQRRAAMWFSTSARPQGWQMPPAWDPLAGDYPTADGWIRLHTNAPHHRDAALRVLGCAAERAAVAAEVATRPGEVLEAAVLAEGGCAAVMRPETAWAAHPQGRAVAAEPLIGWTLFGQAASVPRPACATAEAPLAGLRVLDLTRVLAGPVATRFLAGLGATVLRLDPPHWNEPSVEPEMTLGKRCAGIDLRAPADRARFETLLGEADLLFHGYRPGALDGLGYGRDRRAALNPRLIEVGLCAYGWTGPWAGRRGFDSLVQMSSGIAETGRRVFGGRTPVPLPMQALDHATGYLMAAAGLRALARLRRDGTVGGARLSLARTAWLLADFPCAPPARGAAELAPETEADLDPRIEETAWGPLQRLRFPAHLDGLAPCWTRPAGPLRSATPGWD